MECLTLKKSNCKNCYKCIRYCPVKSIRFSGNQAHIIGDECILCGHCYVVCPQNAKVITSEVEKAKVLISSGSPVVVSLAPSFVARYKEAGIVGMRAALKKLGFFDAEETALGATSVKKEYERILREENRDVLISSCCHSINLLIQKYYPSLLPYLADVLSPMQAHAEDIKKRISDAKVVFIGPCIAKKDEASHYESVDAVVTFDQLDEWMAEEGVVPEAAPDETDEGRARLFPTTGGIIETMVSRPEGYDYIAIDGVDKCIDVLEELKKGAVHKCFIEMSACAGSCVGGPVMEKHKTSLIEDVISVKKFAKDKDFSVPDPSPAEVRKFFVPIEKKNPLPSEYDIARVMREMGKIRPEDELNCGSCGYDTCRAKAIAILEGKAEISMCLPYLKEKAESFSDSIVNNTPNGIVVLNENLEVQQINRSAMKILNIRSASDVMGSPVVRVMDPLPFMNVLRTKRNVNNKRTYLTEYKKYIDQTIVYDQTNQLLLSIICDVTEEQTEREKKENISRQTVEIADKVVEKQMRIVQEIASLLGETAAETKIALTKLKESIDNE